MPALTKLLDMFHSFKKRVLNSSSQQSSGSQVAFVSQKNFNKPAFPQINTSQNKVHILKIVGFNQLSRVKKSWTSICLLLILTNWTGASRCFIWNSKTNNSMSDLPQIRSHGKLLLQKTQQGLQDTIHSQSIDCSSSHRFWSWGLDSWFRSIFPHEWCFFVLYSN